MFVCAASEPRKKRIIKREKERHFLGKSSKATVSLASVRAIRRPNVALAQTSSPLLDQKHRGGALGANGDGVKIFH